MLLKMYDYDEDEGDSNDDGYDYDDDGEEGGYVVHDYYDVDDEDVDDEDYLDNDDVHLKKDVDEVGCDGVTNEDHNNDDYDVDGVYVGANERGGNRTRTMAMMKIMMEMVLIIFK